MSTVVVMNNFHTINPPTCMVLCYNKDWDGVCWGSGERQFLANSPIFGKFAGTTWILSLIQFMIVVKVSRWTPDGECIRWVTYDTTKALLLSGILFLIYKKKLKIGGVLARCMDFVLAIKIMNFSRRQYSKWQYFFPKKKVFCPMGF